MSLLIKLSLIVVLTAIAIFLFRKILFSVLNYRDVTNKEIAADITRQRNGIVFNTDTNKLEADQSVIPSFE